MAISCGIDLGTTNSCIVLVGEDGPQLVRDSYGRATVPSVVHRDAAGKLSVGHAAKARLGHVPPPVITVKRKMGTDERVRLGSEECSAVEVSTTILAHLKQLGESGGSTLENAVVTVPAYFNFKQKHDTETAAREAGFKQVIVLQEPVAAALAYCLRVSDEPMIVLAYDLGGGTFDVTVLERTAENEINVLAFGGDKYLGGDDFDTALAEWLRLELKKKNYAVDWNLDVPDEYAKFQRLKGIAEDVKIKLSAAPEAAVNYPGVFADQEGALVDLDLVVSRDTFHALIHERLERSVSITCETVERSGVPLERLSKVILVGGSSRMPWVQQRLRERLGHEPELEDPDTVVAVGAAIKAGLSFQRRIDGRDVALDIDFPERTPRTKVRITGRLSRAVTGWTAHLVRGEWEATIPIESDRLRFENVVLTPGEMNEFGLSLEDDAGDEHLSAALQITHDSTEQQVSAPDALVAKPIAIRTIDGLEILIDAGARLPARVSQTFHTEDRAGTIRVPIYEGGVQITDIQLADVPGSLAVGSPVDVELIFNRDYSVQASAHVRDTGQAARIRFEIPPVHVPTSKDARATLAALDRRWKVAVQVAGGDDADGYRRLSESIEAELVATEPKMAKVAEELSELELLVLSRERAAIEQQQLQPSLDEVCRRLSEADVRAKRKAERGGLVLDEFRAKARQLRERADACWQQRDAAGWREIISSLASLEATSVMSLESMPDGEAAQLALQLAALVSAEMSDSAAVRAALRGADPRQLVLLAAADPHAALRKGLDWFNTLVEAGLVSVPGGVARGGKSEGPRVDVRGLAGLLRGSKS